MARILIIDDDDTLRGIIAKSLTHAGHTVSQANNGRKGVALFKSAPTDLVVTDLVMPEQEGMETIKILHAGFPHLPIIAMSGGLDGSPLYLDLTRRLGARITLTKPFTLQQLKVAIDEILASLPPPAAGTPPETPPAATRGRRRQFSPFGVWPGDAPPATMRHPNCGPGFPRPSAQPCLPPPPRRPRPRCRLMATTRAACPTS